MPTNVTLAMVREAAARIRPVAQRTPVLTSKTFDREAGVSAFFKCENLQKGGAFKIRGAANLIFSLSDAEQAPELDALITPIGGGGLLSGCAVAAKGVNPKIRIFGVEPERANDTYLSLRKGERVEVQPDTIADGLRSPMPGKLTFPIIREL